MHPAKELRNCEQGYQMHMVRGDATNSAAAQRTKVHFCAATSTYYCPAETDHDDSEEMRRFDSEAQLDHYNNDLKNQSKESN